MMSRTLGGLFQVILIALLVLLVATDRVLGQCVPSVPVASFTQNKDTVICSGTAVVFFADDSAYKPDYSWDFGNTLSATDTASGDTVTYTFVNTGTSTRVFHVFLLVIDSCGNLDSTSQN